MKYVYLLMLTEYGGDRSFEVVEAFVSEELANYVALIKNKKALSYQEYWVKQVELNDCEV